jgi:hypothetical protein
MSSIHIGIFHPDKYCHICCAGCVYLDTLDRVSLVALSEGR